MAENKDNSGFDTSGIIERTGGRSRKLRAYVPPSEQFLDKVEEPAGTLQPETPPVEKVSLPAAEPEPVSEEPVQETVSTPPRKRKRGQVETYDEVFLKRKELKTRQSVYISQEIHASIARLVHVLALAGKEISVGGYIDNVLAEHMESHKDVIAELYRQQLDKFL